MTSVVWPFHEKKWVKENREGENRQIVWFQILSYSCGLSNKKTFTGRNFTQKMRNSEPNTTQQPTTKREEFRFLWQHSCRHPPPWARHRPSLSMTLPQDCADHPRRTDEQSNKAKAKEPWNENLVVDSQIGGCPPSPVFDIFLFVNREARNTSHE